MPEFQTTAPSLIIATRPIEDGRLDSCRARNGLKVLTDKLQTSGGPKDQPGVEEQVAGAVGHRDEGDDLEAKEPFKKFLRSKVNMKICSSSSLEDRF